MGRRLSASAPPARPPVAPVEVRKVAYGIDDLPPRMRRNVLRLAGGQQHLRRITVLSPGRAIVDRGASAVEYGLLVAAIAVVIVGVVFGLGGKLHDAFGSISGSITKCSPTPTACQGP